MPESALIVLAVIEDLFFLAPTQDIVRRAGCTLRQVRDADGLLAGIAAGAKAVIFDLNLRAVDIPALITTARAAAPQLSLIGFVSHVDIAARQSALEAGCSVVLPRSRFGTDLPALLQQAASVHGNAQ
jgi:DNA-binding NarL/FixJ family response regulator